VGGVFEDALPLLERETYAAALKSFPCPSLEPVRLRSIPPRHGRAVSSDGKGRLRVALLSQRSHAVDHQAIEVLRRPVRLGRRLIPIRFPQRKDVRPLLASSNVEGNHALLLARGIPQLAQDRFGVVRVRRSEGEVNGLGLFQGEVRRIPHGPKIPHMGWNQVKPLHADLPIFIGILENTYFYFAHSYYVEPQDARGVAAITEYGSPYCSVIATEQMWGTQFHPEKSGKPGLQLLQNFVKWVKS